MKKALLLFVLITISRFAWGGTEKVLYNFGAPGDASEPVAGLTLDKDGNLYGTAVWTLKATSTAPPYGGAYASSDRGGVVFEVTP